MAASALAVPGCMSLSASNAKRHGTHPNIVLILADDLGYGDLSCYGSETINTPHLDALAANGMKFTNFYVNTPVCSPTRCALLTGRDHLRCGADVVFTDKTPGRGLPLNEITIAEVLKTKGYATGIFGKWHLGFLEKYNPLNQGFDEFVGHLGGYLDYQSRSDALGEYDWWHGKKKTQEEGYSTQLIGDYSCKFIEKNADKPFFLFMSHQAPHSPYQGPDDPPLRKVGEAFSKRQSEEERDAKYIEMVESMDKSIGRVIEQVRKLDLDKNTLIFFMSDNGPSYLAGSAGKLRGGKHSLFEGGIRVPAIAAMSDKIDKGRIVHDQVTDLDIFPTIMAMTDAAPPAGIPLDGTDLSQMLFYNQHLAPRILYWEYLKWRAVRQQQWKLVMKQKGETNEYETFLFNIEKDMAEENNLVEQHPEIVNRLKKHHQQWRTEIANDPLDRLRQKQTD